MRGTLYFVEHQTHQATVVEVVARLLSLEPSRFLTAEGALEAVEGRAPDFLLTDLLLPGGDGLSLIRATKRRSRKTRCVLLSSVPPGLSPGAPERSGIDAIIIRRGAWGRALARLVGEPPVEASARLLTSIERGVEGFDEVASDLIEGRLSPEHESLVLRYVAAAFEPDRVLALLERIVIQGSRGQRPVHPQLHAVALELATGLGGVGFGVIEEVAASMEAPAELRSRAMHHLARCFPHHAVTPILQGNLQDPSPLIRLDAAHALFESAARVGEEGLATLSEIAEARDLPDDLRTAALDRLARELPRSAIKPILVRALKSERPAIKHAASALVMKGDGVDVDSLSAQAGDGPIEARIRALETLAADFPKEAVLPILERFQGASEVAIRQRAFELAMSRADTGFEATLERATREGPAMSQATLLGALRLGAAGFAAVATLAREAAVDVDVRARAARMLGLRFSAPLSAPVLAELSCGSSFEVASAALLASVQLGAPGFAVLKAAQTSAIIPAVRELALIHLEEHAPDPVFRPALQRALRDEDLAVRARAVELWMRRLGGDFAPLLERLVKSGQRELQDAGLDGAVALRGGGFTAIAAFALRAELHPEVRRRARDILIAEFPEEDTAPILSQIEEPTEPTEFTEPTEPAEPAAPVVEGWEIVPTKPVPPAVAEPVTEPVIAPVVERSEQIDLSRARGALEAAILLGRDGYKAIRALADSRRVPDEVRIQALRRLAADFFDEDVMPVLEKAMVDPSFGVQNVGLACSMLRKDARLPPIAALALDPKVDSSLRIRAVRFLASRFDKEDVKPILEALLDQRMGLVSRAALECLFTSLKYVHPDRVEEHVINLLTEHESTDVKAAAAKALGAFGGEKALQALVRFTGLFADGMVKDSANQAAARIRGRLYG